jgi:hypothetical protein
MNWFNLLDRFCMGFVVSLWAGIAVWLVYVSLGSLLRWRQRRRLRQRRRVVTVMIAGPGGVRRGDLVCVDRSGHAVSAVRGGADSGQD